MDIEQYAAEVRQSLKEESEFWATHDRDAQPLWDELTPQEQYEEDPERYRDENSEPDPDDLRDNRIFEEGLAE